MLRVSRWLRWTAWGGRLRGQAPAVAEAETRLMLSIEQMGRDPKVPRDERLRFDPAEVLLVELTQSLAREYPRLSGVRWAWFDAGRRSDVDGILRRHDPKWVQQPLEDKLKLSRRREELRQDLCSCNAVAYPTHRVVYVSGAVKTNLASRVVFDRAVGARTVMHEAWHLMRLSRVRHRHFEEGTADLFAALKVEELCGADIRKTLVYRELSNSMRTLLSALGLALGQPPLELLMASREAPDQLVWLREVLEQAGISGRARDAFMDATDGSHLGVRLCYAAVEDILSEVKHELERT